MPVVDAHDDGDDGQYRSALLDRAGFEAIDLAGGAVFDVCVRYLREDPWERMRILSSWVTATPLVVMTRSQSLFTFEFFPDDIVALAAERIYANGIRYHTPYDALNDMRNMEVPVRAAKQVGLYVAGGVVFGESPVHTDAYFARKLRELVALGVRCRLPQGRRAWPPHAGARRDARSGSEGRLRRAAAAAPLPLPDSRACPLMRPSRPSSSASMLCTPPPRRSPTALRTRRLSASSRMRAATALTCRSTLRRSRRPPSACAISRSVRESRSAKSPNMTPSPLRASDAGRHGLEPQIPARRDRAHA